MTASPSESLCTPYSGHPSQTRPLARESRHASRAPRAGNPGPGRAAQSWRARRREERLKSHDAIFRSTLLDGHIADVSGSHPETDRGVAQGGNPASHGLHREASCPRDVRPVGRNSHAPSAPQAGLRGARRRGRPHQEASRQGGCVPTLEQGRDWPGQFRTQKISMESRR